MNGILLFFFKSMVQNNDCVNTGSTIIHKIIATYTFLVFVQNCRYRQRLIH